MDRSIGRLAEGRIEKIISRLRAKGITGTESFVRKHYVNTAGYGKFNTEDETNAMIKLLTKDATMTQATPVTAVESLTEALRKARQAEVFANDAHKSAITAVETAIAKRTAAGIKVGDAQADVAQATNELGKAKLAAAISLIETVIAGAPVGSAAYKDVHGLTERLMQRRLTDTLSQMAYASPFAKRTTLPKFDARFDPPVPGPKAAPVGGVTAVNIANATTAVGAGAPRQARPSPSTTCLCGMCKLTVR